MKEAQDSFIDPKYLPKNLVLVQYHHMRVEDVDAALQHWKAREASGEVPFRFKKVDKAARCRRRAFAIAAIKPAGQPEGPHDTHDTQGDGSGSGNAAGNQTSVSSSGSKSGGVTVC